MNDTTAPNRSPSLMRMSAPLIVSFWTRAAVTFVDTIFAAFLGDAAIAAIGLTVPIEFLMIAGWVGLSTGLTSRLSRALGAGENSKFDQYLRVGSRCVWIITPLFALIGVAIWYGAPALGLETAVARNLQIYGAVLVGGSAFTTFWSILPDSIVKAHHDTRSTMWAGIWTNTINLGLNTFFLFVLGWGIFGIALSTVLARIAGLVYALIRARRHERERRARSGAGSTDLDPAPYGSVLRLAIPSAITFALMATETGLINALLATTAHSTEAIAAYSIYHRIVLFGLQPIIAMSVALLPFAARRFGEDDCASVRRGLRQASVATALYSMVLVGPVMFLASPWITDKLAESAIMAAYARTALFIVPLACLVNIPFLLNRPVFEAMQRGRPGLLMAILRYLVLTGPLAWLGLRMAGNMGQPPLYGLIAGTLIAGAVASTVFHVWLQRELPADGPPPPAV